MVQNAAAWLGMEDVTLHMLIIILTPFIIYLIAEEFHLSGILAVVAAGVTHAVERIVCDQHPLNLELYRTAPGL